MSYQPEYTAMQMAQLVVKKLDGRLSEAEERELAQWLSRSAENRAVYDELMDDQQRARAVLESPHLHPDKVLQRTWARYESRRKTRPLMAWLAIGAVLLATISAALFMYRASQSTQTETLTSQYGGDALPGGNRATLTLADGKIIELDSISAGEIAQQSGITITKSEDGMITYETRNSATEEAGYNTVATPIGGQYQVVLPDGSHVWLNAASSLRYPTRFNGERRVILTGEGFFSVQHDVSRPFTVETNGQEVKVLGTEFNINAYENSPGTQTTLISGSVNLLAGNNHQPFMLKPGQQAQVSGSSVEITEVDTAPFTAWKDGDFNFDDTDLKEVCRQLERWYGIEVDYNTIPDWQIYARISRNKKLSTILEIIETTSGFKFALNERRLRIDK